MMTNAIDFRLPPINSLALDMPSQMPQSLQHYHQNSIPASHLHGLSSPQLAATVSQNTPHVSSLRTSSVPAPNVPNLYNAQSNWPQAAVHPSPFIPQYSGPAPLQSTHHFPGLTEYTLSHVSPVDSPLSSRFSRSYSSGHTSPSSLKMPTKDVMQLPAPLLQQPSPTSSRRASANVAMMGKSENIPNEAVAPAYTQATAPSVFAAAEASKVSVSQETKDATMKKRKKRQCPDCHLFFSNLATHKSTHLNPTARPHVCTVCSRGFARPNDLFRHNKCHWKETGTNSGQFKCPFKAEGEGEDSQCSHVSGIFSRCDTYKNHLKAIHFEYPAGTRKGERAHSAGRCGVCHQQFSTVEEWLTTHIDGHKCEKMKVKLANEV